MRESCAPSEMKAILAESVDDDKSLAETTPDDAAHQGPGKGNRIAASHPVGCPSQ